MIYNVTDKLIMDVESTTSHHDFVLCMFGEGPEVDAPKIHYIRKDKNWVARLLIFMIEAGYHRNIGLPTISIFREEKSDFKFNHVLTEEVRYLGEEYLCFPDFLMDDGRAKSLPYFSKTLNYVEMSNEESGVIGGRDTYKVDVDFTESGFYTHRFKFFC